MPPRKKNAPVKPAKTKKQGDTLDPSREWSLDELEPHLPKVDAADVALVRERLLRAQTDAQLVALGSDFRTEDILAVAPPFLVGSLLAVRQLDEPPVGFAPSLLRLLFDEARELGDVNAAFELEARSVASGIAGRRSELKMAKSRALRARGRVSRTLLRQVLPAESSVRERLVRASARAETPAAVVASVRTVADILAELREDELLHPILDHYRLDEACIAELRALARDVEQRAKAGAGLTPPQRTDQKALDRQDGIVLAILRAIWSPLRDARDDGAMIKPPPLGALERLVMKTASGADDDVVDEGGAAEGGDAAEGGGDAQDAT